VYALDHGCEWSWDIAAEYQQQHHGGTVWDLSSLISSPGVLVALHGRGLWSGTATEQ
jgi:hypothetical protein